MLYAYADIGNKEQRKYILPNKKTFDKDSIHYDLCSNTQDYLKPYIYINKQLENLNDENIRLFNGRKKPIKRFLSLYNRYFLF